MNCLLRVFSMKHESTSFFTSLKASTLTACVWPRYSSRETARRSCSMRSKFMISPQSLGRWSLHLLPVLESPRDQVLIHAAVLSAEMTKHHAAWVWGAAWGPDVTLFNQPLYSSSGKDGDARLHASDAPFHPVICLVVDWWITCGCPPVRSPLVLKWEWCGWWRSQPPNPWTAPSERTQLWWLIMRQINQSPSQLEKDALYLRLALNISSFK